MLGYPSPHFLLNPAHWIQVLDLAQTTIPEIDAVQAKPPKLKAAILSPRLSPSHSYPPRDVAQARHAHRTCQPKVGFCLWGLLGWQTWGGLLNKA